MKKTFLLLGLFLMSTTRQMWAQELTGETKAVFDACLAIRAAIGAGNTAGLKAANKRLRESGTKDFASLRPISQSPLSLDGHFVFDEDFVDSLIAGREVYKFAQRYANTRSQRGASSSGKVFTRTCAVRAKESVKFSFVSRDEQQLAVVAEPGGLVTLRVYDSTHKKWYNDTQDVKKGREARYLVFTLPKTEVSRLELEVINTGKKDISFVVISN